MATDWRQTSTARPVSAAGASRLRPQRGMRAFSARSLSDGGSWRLGFFANGPESARTGRATTDEAWSGRYERTDWGRGADPWLSPRSGPFLSLSSVAFLRTVVPWTQRRGRAKCFGSLEGLSFWIPILKSQPRPCGRGFFNARSCSRRRQAKPVARADAARTTPIINPRQRRIAILRTGAAERSVGKASDCGSVQCRRRGGTLDETEQAEWVERCREGGFTLVLGSGVSAPRGLPTWEALAQDLWRAAFGKRRSPWETDPGVKSPREVPQFLPIVLELAHRKLGQEKFIDALRTKLYANARFPVHDVGFRKSPESLAVLGRLIVQEFHRGGRRRINAVVTFNADDLLEQAVFASQPPQPKLWGGHIVRICARATGRRLGMPGTGPIPIYHLHGFAPANIKGLYRKGWSKFPRFFDHNLVFTDAQYWSTTAQALTFANSVMSWVLSESRCMFVGLSMTDINVLRWLALRTLELERDAEEVARFARNTWSCEAGIQHVRHVWIRANKDDPSGFLSEFLALRGVASLEIESWSGAHFDRLIRRCFPASRRR